MITMHDWTKITVPKPRPPSYSKLGQVKGAHSYLSGAKPWTDAERRRIIRELKHWRCIAHVRVDGYREQLCVERGRDESDVVREALELSEGQPPSSTGVWLVPVL